MVIFGYLTMVIALLFKTNFFLSKCDYENNSSAPSVRFKINLIKGLTIHKYVLERSTFFSVTFKRLAWTWIICWIVCLTFVKIFESEKKPGLQNQIIVNVNRRQPSINFSKIILRLDIRHVIHTINTIL